MEIEQNVEDDVGRLQERWAKLNEILKEQFGQKHTIESILFLIGVRELGKGPEDFTKEEKVDLMHIAICALLAPAGFYALSYTDQEGWPHWEQVKELPFIDIFSQEIFLKSHIVDYFADIFNI